MKKIALTSLVAVFAASGAMAAANVSNPMYRPDAGMFYSKTTVETTNSETNVLWLGEEFGYGITDRFAVSVGAVAGESDWFNDYAWDSFSLGADWRAVSHGNWHGDLFAKYSVGNVWGKDASFLDKDDTMYQWTAGLRFGYVEQDWTVAGHVAFNYLNTESFNWDEMMSIDGYDVSIHMLSFGVDGWLRLNKYWNVFAGVEYNAFVGHGMWEENLGSWTGKIGANLTLDDTKYIGAFVGKEMTHDAAGEWNVEDGFTFGATFGIEF